MSDDAPKGFAAWLPTTEHQATGHVFGVDRVQPTRRLIFDTSRWRDRWAWRWYRVRAWIARNILRVVTL